MSDRKIGTGHRTIGQDLKSLDRDLGNVEYAVSKLLERIEALEEKVSGTDMVIDTALGIMQKNNAEMSLHLKRLDAVLSNIIRLGGLDEPKG